MKKILVFLFTFFISCQIFAQHSNHVPQTKVSIDPVLTIYYKVKNALIASDPKTTAALAKELGTALKSTGKIINVNALKAVNVMASSTDIEAQRKQLGTLTASIYDALKVAKSSKSVYYDFCPMANDNKGGYWLSETKEISNPYFGKMMLKCGSVKETIE